MNCCSEGNETGWNGKDSKESYRYEIIPDSSARRRKSGSKPNPFQGRNMTQVTAIERMDSGLKTAGMTNYPALP